MYKGSIGRFWRRVKAWTLARVHPARVVSLDLAAECPACRRRIAGDASWIVWNDAIWHVECLARRRGWDLRAENPADVLPDRSINRHEPDGRDPGYTVN